MVIGMLLAGGLLGASAVRLTLLAVIWYSPALGTALLGLALVAALFDQWRPSPSRPAALVLLDVAADLQSGGTIRSALAVEGRFEAAVARAAMAGRPLHDVAELVATSTVPGSAVLAPALRMIGRTGGAAAPVFEAIAGMVFDDEEVAREIKSATAGPLVQAAIIGGVPLCSLLVSMTSGSLGRSIARGGVDAALVTVGSVCVGLGISLVWLIMRRVRGWR